MYYHVLFPVLLRQLVFLYFGIKVDVSLMIGNNIANLPFENTYVPGNNLITSFAAYAAPWSEKTLPTYQILALRACYVIFSL